jgi:hypothetical protein
MVVRPILCSPCGGEMSEQPGASPITVDITSLAGVGERMLEEAAGLEMRSAGVLFTMNDNRTNFAGGGLAEGATFQVVHDGAHAGLVQFLNDVVNGLETLGRAAVEISAAYGEADTLAAVSVDKVETALHTGSTGPQPA